MNQFKAIESVRMRAKRTKRRKEMGKKIDPGWARLGKKMDRLVVYTSLITVLKNEQKTQRGHVLP